MANGPDGTVAFDPSTASDEEFLRHYGVGQNLPTGTTPAVQPPPPASAHGGPSWELGDVASRYGEAFKRGAINASPVAAGTLALGAATGPGFMAAVPAALGEEAIGGLGGVAEQGVDDLRSATGYNIPQWVGPAVGTGIGFTGAGMRLAGAGIKAAGSAIAGGAAGVAGHATGAFSDILRIAAGDTLANSILSGGLAHAGALTLGGIGAATAYGLYTAAKGVGGLRAGTWEAVAPALAGYMGTGQYMDAAKQAAGDFTNALSGRAAGSTAPSPAANLGGLLFGIPPAEAGTPPPEWTGNAGGGGGMTISAPRDFQDPSERRFYPPPQ